MKNYILPVLILLSGVACKKVNKNATPASFTVTSANLANIKPGVSFEFFQPLLPDSAIVAPISGTDFSYDYTGLNILGTSSISYDSALNAMFPTATYTAPRVDTFGAGTVKVAATSAAYFENNSADLAYLGLHTDSQMLSYAGIGSIKYPEQDVVSSDKIIKVKFPLNYQDSWSGFGIKSTYNFVVNAPLAGFNNTPGTQVTTTDYTANVIASGYMKLQGFAENTLAVLAVKEQMTTKVNYFVNGSPAPGTLLSLAGLTDGQVKVTTSYSFYSPSIGYVGTLYMDNTNTTVQSATLRKMF